MEQVLRQNLMQMHTPLGCLGGRVEDLSRRVAVVLWRVDAGVWVIEHAHRILLFFPNTYRAASLEKRTSAYGKHVKLLLSERCLRPGGEETVCLCGQSHECVVTAVSTPAKFPSISMDVGAIMCYRRFCESQHNFAELHARTQILLKWAFGLESVIIVCCVLRFSLLHLQASRLKSPERYF